jgi:hypothetical protein
MTTEIINSLSLGLPPATTDAVNANDVHRFVYTWFTVFEHRAPAARLTRHRQQWSVIARSGNALEDPVSIVEVTAGKR